MKTVPFLIAALFVSAGCVSLLLGHPNLMFFITLPLVLSDVSRYLRPPRQIIVLYLAILGFAVAVLACQFLLPVSAFKSVQRVICHPAFVVPLWLFAFWGLFRWHRELQS